MSFSHRFLLLFKYTLLVLVSGQLVVSVNGLAAAPDPLREAGLLDVTALPYAADPTGQEDATEAIQRAIEDAYATETAVFFPPGTYLISDTLAGLQYQLSNCCKRHLSHVLIGSTSSTRPVIKLQANAPGFGNPNNPKPIIHLWTEEENVGNRPSVGYHKGVRGIDIIVGEGNEGAIGLWMEGAQENYIMNVTVDLSRGGFAGLYNLVGTDSVLTNIKVIGGRYGIYAPEARWPSITDLTLVNQTEYAIFNFHSSSPLTVTGFKIVKESAPVIKTSAHGGGNSFSSGNMSLIDGTIELATLTEAAVIDNTGASHSTGRSLVLQNIYFWNAATLVASADFPSVTGGAGWTHLQSYAFPIQEENGISNVGVNLVDGMQLETPLVGAVTRGVAPAVDLRARHGLVEAAYPSPDVILDAIETNYGVLPNGLTVADIRDYGAEPARTLADAKSSGAPDSTAAIQQAIAENDVVFVPKGYFLVSEPIVLAEETQLIGVTNLFSEIWTHRDWQPTAANPGVLLETVESETAVTRMAFLQLRWHTSPVQDWFDAVHWHAGRHSEVVSVTRYPLFGKENGVVTPRTNTLISGSGGGRWFGAGFIGGGKRNTHPDYRQLMIQGTTEPLIIYGLNIEDGHGDWQMEIRNAQNVAIFGFKSENVHAMRVVDSGNIAAFGWGGDSVSFVAIDSAPLLVGNVSPKNNERVGDALLEQYQGQTNSVSLDRVVALYKRGEVDFSLLFAEPGQILPTPQIVAVSDLVYLHGNTATEILPLQNDRAANGAPLSLTAVSTPTHGTATITGAQQIIYLPAAGYLGEDRFSYTVQDGAGHEATAEIVVWALAPAQRYSMPPAGDAFTNSKHPGTNKNHLTTLKLDLIPLKQSYLQFVLPPYPIDIENATLWLYSYDSSDVGVRLYEVPDAGWDERTITHSNAPPFGSLITTTEPITANTWLHIDVTAVITQGRPFSLGLAAIQDERVIFDSREGSNPPQLVIVTAAE